MPFQSPEMLAPCSVAMRMPSPVSKRVPGEISLMVSAAGPEMRAHHRGVALKSAAGENDGIGIERCRGTVAGLNARRR